MSIVTFEKPGLTVSVSDWHGRISELGETAHGLRNEACQLRSGGRQLRNETNIQTKWDGYISNARLKDRVYEITKWRDMLKACSIAIQKEAASLKEEKERTDVALEMGINIPVHVVSECLTLRDTRHGNDLNQDEVYLQLHQELHVIESLKASLSGMCFAAWEQLTRLKEEETRIQIDVEDKQVAYEIDNTQLRLNSSSSTTSYKNDPLQIPLECIPSDEWVEHSRNNQSRAQHQMVQSAQLREAMFYARGKALNDLKAQHDATNFALRKRIYAGDRAVQDLTWQRSKLVREMDLVGREVEALEVALREKTDVGKLAESRLETRMFRPPRELLHDEPQRALANQVLKIREAQHQLAHKATLTKISLSALENHVLKIDEDLSDKKHALATDKQCVEIRKRLLSEDRLPPASQMERDIKLASMEQDIRSMRF